MRKKLQESDVLEAALALDELVGWSYNAILDQLVVRRLPRVWQVMLKARVSGKQMITYVTGSTYTEALQNTRTHLESRWLEWFPDKFPPRLHRFNR